MHEALCKTCHRNMPASSIEYGMSIYATGLLTNSAHRGVHESLAIQRISGILMKNVPTSRLITTMGIGS
ncbi:MAG: hypothetical protein QXS54_00875 [Candidatus Methanomethylicaceae archaeon]